MSYSQNGEDKIIAKYFGDFKGTLLDIGANNGVTFSNSRMFIENGWCGVLIEPSLAFEKLQSLYKDVSRVTCHNFGISDKEAIVTWYEVEDSLLSSTSKDHADKWGRPYETKTIQVMPYSVLGGAKFDFITIDAEGEDWNILQQIDLTDTKCLCIEYGANKSLIEEYCIKAGMYLNYMNGKNMIFIR